LVSRRVSRPRAGRQAPGPARRYPLWRSLSQRAPSNVVYNSVVGSFASPVSSRRIVASHGSRQGGAKEHQVNRARAHRPRICHLRDGMVIRKGEYCILFLLDFFFSDSGSFFIYSGLF
ncbi:Os01g0154000, partial [Oryza sativa Japonica Group]